MAAQRAAARGRHTGRNSFEGVCPHGRRHIWSANRGAHLAHHRGAQPGHGPVVHPHHPGVSRAVRCGLVGLPARIAALMSAGKANDAA